MTQRPTELRRLSFSAEDPDDFGAYHDLYDSGTSVSRNGAPFRAALKAFRFPKLLLFDRKVGGANHLRDATRVRRDGFNHFNLQVLRAGTMAAGRPGDERRMRPGDIVVFDTIRPQHTLVERADYVSVAIPREAIEAALPQAGRLHGAVLSAENAGMLGDFLLSLGRNAPTLNPDLASRSAYWAGELLAGVAGEAVPHRAELAPAADTLALHRWRAEAFIEAHLNDRGLDPERIAAGLAVSRSVLYRAFAADGGVARHIIDRRLARLRLALSRPGEGRSFSALAFDIGFAEERHCARAFKAAFGASPREFRAQFRTGLVARDEPRGGGWAKWWGEIS